MLPCLLILLHIFSSCLYLLISSLTLSSCKFLSLLVSCTMPFVFTRLIFSHISFSHIFSFLLKYCIFLSLLNSCTFSSFPPFLSIIISSCIFSSHIFLSHIFLSHIFSSCTFSSHIFFHISFCILDIFSYLRMPYRVFPSRNFYLSLYLPFFSYRVKSFIFASFISSNVFSPYVLSY